MISMKKASASSVSATSLAAAILAAGNPATAQILQRFFKTAPGQYGEGDRFAGVKIPVLRALVRQHKAIAPREAVKLMRSGIHEHRLAALMLWVHHFERGDEAVRRSVFDLYLAHTRYINNWDLVDVSAPQVVGGFLDPADTAFLRTLAQSPLLWERRIAIVCTHSYIRRNVFAPTLQLCEILLGDRHDLMHKACGWMLREVGKRDRAVLSRFLDQHAAAMPRTMLRYALEHYAPGDRRRYMQMKAKLAAGTPLIRARGKRLA